MCFFFFQAEDGIRDRTVTGVQTCALPISTVRGSDRTVRHGHISKQGPAWLRWILCEAAQTAKRPPQFAASYQAIAARRGKKIATTAIARKLLTRAWHLLTAAEHLAAAQATTTASAPASP